MFLEITCSQTQNESGASFGKVSQSSQHTSFNLFLTLDKMFHLYVTALVEFGTLYMTRGDQIMNLILFLFILSRPRVLLFETQAAVLADTVGKLHLLGL